MKYTVNEVCEFLNSKWDFTKAPKGFNNVVSAAAKQIGFTVVVKEPTTVLVKTNKGTLTYQKVATPESKEMQALLLTHAMLTQQVHES